MTVVCGHQTKSSEKIRRKKGFAHETSVIFLTSIFPAQVSWVVFLFRGGGMNFFCPSFQSIWWAKETLHSHRPEYKWEHELMERESIALTHTLVLLSFGSTSYGTETGGATTTTTTKKRGTRWRNFFFPPLSQHKADNTRSNKKKQVILLSFLAVAFYLFSLSLCRCCWWCPISIASWKRKWILRVASPFVCVCLCKKGISLSSTAHAIRK